MQRKINMPLNVVKLKPLLKREVFSLKPSWQSQPTKAHRPTKDYLNKNEILLPLPASIMIGGLSDIYFALFAHIGQKEGCDTVYRRLSKFEITIKGPSWTMNTARTFLLLAEYFQKVWWFRSTTIDFKMMHLERVDIRTILLSCPEVFKKPLQSAVLVRHWRDTEIISKTSITLRDLETGEIHKNIANLPILQKYAMSESTLDMIRHVGKSDPNMIRHVGKYPENEYAMSESTSEPIDFIGDAPPIGKRNRKDFITLGKLNPQAVNYLGGSLMWIQIMTGGRGRYKLQAFDCELPTDHRKMAEYLSRAFFSAWRNTGNETRMDRNVCFKTYAASIGMSSALKNDKRKRVIDILNATAPYFCTVWGVEDNILKFVMSRHSNRKKDIYG